MTEPLGEQAAGFCELRESDVVNDDIEDLDASESSNSESDDSETEAEEDDVKRVANESEGIEKKACDEGKTEDVGGYDPDLFVDKDEAENNFGCSLCLLVMKEPTSIGCDKRHCFCKSCLDDFFEKVEETKSLRGREYEEGFFDGAKKKIKGRCPLCNQDVCRDDMTLDEDKEMDILALDVLCKECGWEGELTNYQEHLQSECGKEKEMTIFIKMWDGKTRTFANIHKSDTVASLQQKIEDKEGIERSHQRLLYGAKTMYSRKDVYIYGEGQKIISTKQMLLQDYNVTHGCTIQLIKRYRGGL